MPSRRTPVRRWPCDLPGLMIAAAALGLAHPAEAQFPGEDFTGTWGLYTPIDTNGQAETPLTPLANANNRSLGTWGGYYPVAGALQGGVFISDGTLPTLIQPKGSLFGVANPGSLGNGFLIFGAYPATGGAGEDETGGYAYTGFTASPTDLSGSGRIQFDVGNGCSQPSASINLRLLLRIKPSSPEWVISERLPITGAVQASLASPPVDGSIMSDIAIIDAQPSALAWTRVTGPSDATLIPVTSGGEAALVFGPAVAAPDLTQVTAFGIEVDDDIARGDAYGIVVDAIRFTPNNSTSSVESFGLYR